MLFGFSGVLIGFSGSVLWICVVRNHRLSSLGWSWGCAPSVSKCMFGKSVRGVVYCSLGLVACNCLLSFSWKDFRGWKAELKFRIFESRDFGRYVRTSGLGRNFPFCLGCALCWDVALWWCLCWMLLRWACVGGSDLHILYMYRRKLQLRVVLPCSASWWSVWLANGLWYWSLVMWIGLWFMGCAHEKINWKERKIKYKIMNLWKTGLKL